MALARRRVATYVADGLATDRAERIQRAAAWLVARRRTTDAPLLARDVASIMGERGYVAATATTARTLTADLEKELSAYVKTAAPATDVELATIVDPTVIGGLKLELPDATLDATIRTKLQTFVTEMSL